MYNIEYCGVPLQIDVESLPAQKGDLETEPLEESFEIRAVKVNGQDISDLISLPIMQGIEVKVKQAVYAR